MTRGQRALNDLEIILDDAGLEHDEIIQGWIGKIAAELAAAPATTAECDRLRETNRQLVKACEDALAWLDAISHGGSEALSVLVDAQPRGGVCLSKMRDIIAAARGK